MPLKELFSRIKSSIVSKDRKGPEVVDASSIVRDPELYKGRKIKIIDGVYTPLHVLPPIRFPVVSATGMSDGAISVYRETGIIQPEQREDSSYLKVARELMESEDRGTLNVPRSMTLQGEVRVIGDKECVLYVSQLG